MGYDAANQLLSAAVAGSNSVNYAYGYDPSANRSFEKTNLIQRGFNYNALNQLLSSSNTTGSNVIYQWDAQQRVTEIIQGANRSQFSMMGWA